ncbi:MAG: hypothetical protein IPJ06_10675 [Saprospiraceae bacterium]|nr:hypothetical protein [Saprospiraceae bacterium]
MLKDIDQLKMLEFGVAMIPSNNRDEEGQMDWECYLINLRKEPVHGVLVTSTGYKTSEEDELRSSTLRFFL